MAAGYVLLVANAFHASTIYYISADDDIPISDVQRNWTPPESYDYSVSAFDLNRLSVMTRQKINALITDYGTLWLSL